MLVGCVMKLPQKKKGKHYRSLIARRFFGRKKIPKRKLTLIVPPLKVDTRKCAASNKQYLYAMKRNEVQNQFSSKQSAFPNYEARSIEREGEREASPN